MTRQCFIGLAGYFTDFIFVGILFTGFFYIGKKIFEYLKFDLFDNRTEFFLFSFAIGETLVAYSVLTFGLAGLLNRWFFLSLFFIFSYGAWQERKNIADFLTVQRQFLVRKIPPLYFLCAVLIGVALFRAVVATCVPPTDWDSLAYHLAFPKIFLKHEKIFEIPWSANAHYPLNTEMIFTIALALKNDLSAHWINFGHAVLLLVLILLIVKRYFLKETAILASLIFLAQPVVQRVIGNASTDFSVAVISMLSFLAFFRGIENKDETVDKKWFFLSGSLSGMAMNFKLTGTWTMATIIMVYLMVYFSKMSFRTAGNHWREEICERRKTRSLISRIRGSDMTALQNFIVPVSYCFLGAVILGFPFYLKNLVETGNPIWPYLGQWFGASKMEIEAWSRLQVNVAHGVEKTFFHWICLPFLLAVKGDIFLYGLQYLFAPFFFFLVLKIVRKEIFSSFEKIVLLTLLIYGSIWFWVMQISRYMMPMILMVAILIAEWTIRLWKREGYVRWVSIAVLFSFIPLKNLSMGNEGYVFLNLKSKNAPNLSAKERYLELTCGLQHVMAQISNRRVPEHGKILFIGEVRGYYYDREYVWGDTLNPGLFSYSGMKDSKELYQTIRNLGFTHVLYNPSMLDYIGDQKYYSRSKELIEKFLNEGTEPLVVIQGVGLYKIN